MNLTYNVPSLVKFLKTSWGRSSSSLCGMNLEERRTVQVTILLDIWNYERLKTLICSISRNSLTGEKMQELNMKFTKWISVMNINASIACVCFNVTLKQTKRMLVNFFHKGQKSIFLWPVYNARSNYQSFTVNVHRKWWNIWDFLGAFIRYWALNREGRLLCFPKQVFQVQLFLN